VALLLLLVEETKRVENEVGIADRLDSVGELVRRFLKLEGAVRDLHYSLKTLVAPLATAQSIDDAAVVEFHLAFMSGAVQREYAVQPRVLDYLHGVEDTDRAEIAGECEVFAFEDRLGSGRWFQVGPARAADRLEAAGDIDPLIELFGFEQPLVRGVEILAFNVEARECETLAGSFVVVCLGGADFAKTFAQFD